MKVWPGQPYPQGATWDGAGVNFALFSENATAVELCLCGGSDGAREVARIPMTEQTDQAWHVYLPEVRPGQLYGYRVYGPYAPAAGHRFNPAKLLLDPYAKAIAGTIRWSDALFGYTVGHPDADLSQDERGGRRPYASINFVTAHDGFTLHDLVSYNAKHNEANGEENRDGHNDNLSWNCGVEGPTNAPAILALRARQQRNFLATLLFSQGVPMLLAGDEIGRPQQGNNNAYCQDNETSWVDWQLDRPRWELLEFTRLLIRLFRRHPVLRRRKFFQGRRIRGSEVKDLAWFRPDGKEMTDEDWDNPQVRFLGLRLAGDAIEEVDARGNRIVDDTLLLLLNAHHEPLAFILPAHRPKVRWELVLDTRDVTGHRPHRLKRGGAAYELEARSVALFRLHRETPKREA